MLFNFAEELLKKKKNGKSRFIKSQEGVFVIFGYSAIKYEKGLKRSFASVTIVNDKKNASL